MSISLPLAELHLHLYGCIRYDALLRHLRSASLDWESYESAYEVAYGTHSPARAFVEAYRAGEPADPEVFRRIFELGDVDAGNFARFSARFGLLMVGSAFRAVARGERPLSDAISEGHSFAQEILRDQAQEGIAYAEQRLRPGPDVPVELARTLWGSFASFYAGETQPGLRARLAPSLPREDPWPQWEVVQELALGPHGTHVTGIDFCHVEEGFPPNAMREFMADVHAHNARHPTRALAILYHVGESYTDKSLESAVRWVQEAAELGVHRLGHAIALGIAPAHYAPHTRSESVAERLDQLAYDLRHADELEHYGVLVDGAALEAERRRLEDRVATDTVDVVYDVARLSELRGRQDFAMDRVRRTGAIIEVCPTSNRRIGGIINPDHHPVHRFLAADLPVVVATDDPGIFGVRLAEEIDWVVEQCGLDDVARRGLIERAWRSRSEVLTGRVKPG